MENNYKLLLIVIFLLGVSHPAYAASTGKLMDGYNVSTETQSLKNGATIYYNLCRLCHSLKYIKYQHFLEVGFTKTEVNELRGTQSLATPIMSTADDTVANQMFGMVPPDLSVMAKARKNGPDYIYSLMLSYIEKENGGYDNALFHGIKMPDVFAISIAQNDSEKSALKSKAADVTSFLTWASDPHAMERKQLGIYVIIYLIVLSALFYLIMRRVWARLGDNK